jgi:hypothetical protein
LPLSDCLRINIECISLENLVSLIISQEGIERKRENKNERQDIIENYFIKLRNEVFYTKLLNYCIAKPSVFFCVFGMLLRGNENLTPSFDVD